MARNRLAPGRRTLAVFTVVLTGLVAGSLAIGRVRTEAPTAAPAAAVAPPAPADAAVALQAALGYHSILAADMMRSRLRGDEDLARAAETAVARNTDDMRELVAALLGAARGEQFRLLWSAHVAALANYSRGVADEDNGARDAARATLSTFEGDLAGFLSDGSQGRLPREAAKAAAYLHVDHLMQQADAFAAGDYARADQLYREGYAHTFALGETIATALLGPRAAAALRAPAWRLRSQLTLLLGEHVALAVAATRAGVTNAPDFAAAGEAVNANTRDLAGAIDALFGAAAAQRFQSLWADHVEQLVAYTGGVASGDRARREDAVGRLTGFEQQFAAFLSDATGGRLPVTALARTLLMHDQMLMAQVDAYVAKQYEQAHESAYATYGHMGEVARDLAEAFGGTVGARLPTGGSQTGLGGMAGAHAHGSR
ncbi:hypothetical protein O7635_13965 [Asanoa sp. WMMD1127]|uniref:hypothetical protein n=1 Tax=Asanoa sp. WMMD1127 TaxID=3016107 RepID=UPI0024178D08|nr:hypothetical protein [Asanoa sp. WMMD1127]MDG4822955.1 hypothetical protein [Asanoa sp. WMMD1127]